MGRAVGVRVSGERGAVGAGHARPLQGSKNRDTGPCGSVSLLLMRFYAFLKPTLCMNLTKAA